MTDDKNGAPPREIRGDESGFKNLLAAGIPPEMIVFTAVGAISDTMAALMKAVPKDSVGTVISIQVMALATVIENAHEALKRDVLHGVAIDPELVAAVTALLEGLAEQERTREAGEASDS